MAKTNFENGTIVTPEFLNSIYKTADGHVHDAADDDGKSSKISLANHVKDLLGIGMVDGLSTVLTGLENNVNLILAAVESLENTFEVSGRSEQVQLVPEYMTELQYIGWTLAPGRRVIFKSARWDISDSADVRIEIVVDGPVIKFTSPSNIGSVSGYTTEIFRNETENPTTLYFLIWAKNTSVSQTLNVKTGAGWSLTFEECDVPAE